MSAVHKVEVKSMAGPESVILQLANLRHSCVITLPDSVNVKIQGIKEATSRSETNESQLGWRRTGPSTPSGGWRSGHHANSYKPAHGNGNNQRSQPSSQPQQQQVQQQGQGSHQRYVSRFRKSEAPVDETILNTVILNKLNKFSEVNYEEVKQFLKQIIDSDDTIFLKEFMKLVFRKAASEQMYCPLYARLICELSSQYTCLQKEFESLYKDYLNIFEDIDESKCPDYETFVKRNREKMYRLGYSQFLAELISKGVLQSDDLILLFSKIFEQISNASRESKDKAIIIDEYIQCILRMTRALKNTETINSIHCFEEPIEYLIQNQATEFPGLTKKSVFTLMDCLDILRNEK